MRTLGNLLGASLLLLGTLWWGQGIGFVEGSFMTGQPTWAVIGPAVAGIGLGLLLWTNTRPRPKRARH